MSWFTSIRDAIEGVGSIVGNYFLPGSGLITSRLVSEGAQEMLGSPIGQMAQIGSGVAGGMQGNLSNYGKAWDTMAGSTPSDWTSGYDLPGGGDASPWTSGYDVPSMNAGGNPTGIGPAASYMEGGMPGAAGSWLNNLTQGMKNPMSAMGNWAKSTGVMPWGSPGNLLSIGSGIYGLTQAEALRKMAAMSAAKADPWGASGGRGLADTQLQELLKNPSGVTSLPGYQAGLEAVQRSMAAQGYTGSGNMMAALSKYGGDFYNDAIARLSGMAGTQFNPAAGGQLALMGAGMGTDVASRSLASLGYGVARTQPNQIPPWLQ